MLIHKLAGCAAALLLAACSHDRPAPAVAAPAIHTSHAAIAPQKKPAAVVVSPEILKACNIDFDSPERAPKFDFDRYVLLQTDRDVLDKVANCLTVGPLSGRSIELVGRCDPRGTVAYNYVLGENRASTVETYLADRGVAKAKITTTSRGKLDAIGTNEWGWARDRRVDIDLM